MRKILRTTKVFCPGSFVGIEVGCCDSVGLCVGLKVGAAVVGSMVGATVQFAVKVVGLAEGVSLGGSDGAEEGIGVASIVGIADGELVGA
jgi:hypothetical protein